MPVCTEGRSLDWEAAATALVASFRGAVGTNSDAPRFIESGTDGMVLVVYRPQPGSADADKLALLNSRWPSHRCQIQPPRRVTDSPENKDRRPERLRASLRFPAVVLFVAVVLSPGAQLPVDADDTTTTSGNP
ncbi:hypothetical protein [Micromonospora sp. LOL_021]|uniref:hypothetical protein n=1 Tax=Micromonospora sp. LOL_021 TaxID=3345417 RepID=UPI003A87EB5C